MKRVALMAIFAGLCAIFGCKAESFASVDAEKFAREVAKPKVQLVDVRTAEEYAEGHIPNAVNIDVSSPDFVEKVSTLDKNRTVALYCRSGRRSKRAAELVVNLGFKVVELDGGIISWQGELQR